MFDKDICSNPNNASRKHSFVKRITSHNGKTGEFYVCEYCGRIADDVFNEAYDQHVEDMPVNGITNTGSFVWYPTCRDMFKQGCKLQFSRPVWIETDYLRYENGSRFITDNGYGFSFDFYPDSGSSYIDLDRISLKYSLCVPVSGLFSQLDSIEYDTDYVFSDQSLNKKENYSSGSVIHYSSGDFISFNKTYQYTFYSSGVAVHGSVYFPVYSVTPDVSALVGHENDYTVDTRPAAYIKYFDERIIDESTNTFYMPETNETYDMREWSYDYSDRSYHVTTNEGDKYTVTYGDENMTVYNETSGDTYTYNYYITQEPEPTPTPTPDDPNHKHTYTSETVKEATCTEPGSIKYTCTGCGHSYTESVSSLGHDWVASETVEDSYSFPDGVTCPNGADHGLTYTLNKDDRTYHVTCSDCGKEFDVDAVFAYGHTTYTCSRCGEQRVESNKDSGGLFDAIGDLIANGIRWIVDKLKQLVEAFKGIGDIFERVIEQQEENAGEYPEMMSKVVAIMPEDLMNVLWFSIIGFVAVSVWRKWFK